MASKIAAAMGPLAVARRFVLLLVISAAFWALQQVPTSSPPPLWYTIALHVVRAGLALAVAMVVDAALRAFFWHGYLARVIGARVPRLLPLMVSVAIYVGVLFHLLQADYGFSLGGALAASGVVAIMLGFALRSVILDLFTGLAVSVDRSYVVGDWITVSSRDLHHPVYGQVEDIDWRTTRLRLDDGTIFIMPNSLGGIYAMTNHSQPRVPKRMEISVLLPHETPHARVRALLSGRVLSAMSAPGFAKVPPPVILIGDISPNGIKYLVRFYFDPQLLRPNGARSHVYEAVQEAIFQNGLSFATEKVEFRDATHKDENIRSSRATTQAALGGLPLFRDILTENEVSALSKVARRAAIEARQHLLTQGEHGNSLFVIVSGAAEVARQSENGRRQVLATLSTGDVVGEMSLLTGAPRSADVKALTPLHVIEIDKDALLPIMTARPEIADALAALLAVRQQTHTSNHPPPTDLRDGLKDGAAQRLLTAITSFFGLPEVR